MRMPRIITPFSKYSDAVLENKAQAILAAHTDNEYFKDPVPPLSELIDAIGLFSDAVTAAEGGDRYLKAEKIKARKVLEELLVKLSYYDTMIAAGDRAILISGGYDLERDSESQEVVAPTSIKVSSGPNPGEVEIKITGAKGKISYLYEYTADPLTADSVWEKQPNTKVKHLFKGLTPGKKYWFRVAVVGNGGVSVYSPEFSLFVQ